MISMVFISILSYFVFSSSFNDHKFNRTQINKHESQIYSGQTYFLNG